MSWKYKKEKQGRRMGSHKIMLNLISTQTLLSLVRDFISLKYDIIWRVYKQPDIMFTQIKGRFMLPRIRID